MSSYDVPCPLCEGSGYVDDLTACGDPDHCCPVHPCPNGCPDPDALPEDL